MSPVCGRDLVVFLRLSSQSAAGSGLGTTSMPLQGSVSLIRFLWYLHLADIFGYWIILRQYHLYYKGINIYYQYISSQFISLQSHYVFKTCSDLTSTGFGQHRLIANRRLFQSHSTFFFPLTDNILNLSLSLNKHPRPIICYLDLSDCFASHISEFIK